MIKGEPEERSTHRLEAFSDIVIGFSLAQLGASLALPSHPADLFAHPMWLIAFLWAFAVICTMWWFHHRFFALLFLPRTLPVLLNFLWLAVVVLCVYTAQISSRNLTDVIVWRMYFVLFALAYGLLAMQYRIGIRLRGPQLTSDQLNTAQRQGAFMLLWTVPFTICALTVIVLPWGAASGLIIWATFIAAMFASRMLAKRFQRLQQAPVRSAAG